MLLFSLLCTWGTLLSPVATPASAAFYGVMVATFYAIVSTSVFVFRLLSNQALFGELLGERE